MTRTPHVWTADEVMDGPRGHLTFDLASAYLDSFNNEFLYLLEGFSVITRKMSAQQCELHSIVKDAKDEGRASEAARIMGEMCALPFDGDADLNQHAYVGTDAVDLGGGTDDLGDTEYWGHGWETGDVVRPRPEDSLPIRLSHSKLFIHVWFDYARVPAWSHYVQGSLVFIKRESTFTKLARPIHMPVRQKF